MSFKMRIDQFSTVQYTAILSTFLLLLLTSAKVCLVFKEDPRQMSISVSLNEGLLATSTQGFYLKMVRKTFELLWPLLFFSRETSNERWHLIRKAVSACLTVLTPTASSSKSRGLDGWGEVKLIKQTRTPPSYACPKLWPNDSHGWSVELLA